MQALRCCFLGISIHALREEGDYADPLARRQPRNFYPRPPRGGRRKLHDRAVSNYVISIHALREEGDSYTVEDM